MQRSAAFTTPMLAYGFALIVTACAAAVSLPFRSFFAQNPFTPFYLAAAIAAWYGGLGAGLVSVCGGTLAAEYISLPSHDRFDLDTPGTLLRLLMFIVVAGTITALIAAVHRQRAAPTDPATATGADERRADDRSEGNVAERGLPLRLLDLRTHLTVATLAAAQLRRRHVSTIAAARLCVYIVRAHAQMLDDITALEAELSEDDGMPDPPS